MNKSEREKHHKQKSTRWVKDYLGGLRSVSPDKVNSKDKLIDWGFVDESSYADLTQAFNRTTHTDADWHGSAVTPPQLLKGSGGKTRGGLISRTITVDHLANYLALTTARTRLTAQEIEGILIRRLTGGHGGVVDRNSSLRGVTPSQNEANLINVDCGSSLAVTYYTQCVGRQRPAPTVATVAACMAKKL